ncbi:hypothetical protein [Pseudomonas fragi]|uniref:Uncharacterized protein n=1 Tax=Pseudomonas fragi TaxID=296 RepID=A0A267AW91_PSEFR|nr:hypothetical protein [Pseudomonas fragi]PAA16074.1 hypothetical protein CJU81_02160 [Pseudomonas fragi]
MNHRSGLVVMLMASVAQAQEPALDISSATCLKLNREITWHTGRGVDLPLVELRLFVQTRYRLIEGFEAGQYPLDLLATALYELARDTVKVVGACRRKPSRNFVEMLPESVQTLLKPRGS